MAFTISPQEAPRSSLPSTAKGAESPRDRAIKAYMEPNTAAQAAAQSPQAPGSVPNPSAMAPEDIRGNAPLTRGQFPQNEGTNPEATQEVTGGQQEAAPKAPESDPLSTQYANLARKERAIRAREQQLHKDRQAWEAERDAAAQQTPQAPSFDPSKYVPRDRLAQDPLSVLTEMGYSGDALTNLILNAPSQQDVKVLQAIEAKYGAKIADLESKLEQATKSVQEREDQGYQAALKQIGLDAQRLIDRDPDFETIKAKKMTGEVVKLIEKTYKDDGYVMDVYEACQLIEGELIERAYKDAQIPKVQKRLQSATQSTGSVQQAVKQGEKQQQSQQSKSTTLTNGMASTRQLSAKERAVLAFQGKLNQG